MPDERSRSLSVSEREQRDRELMERVHAGDVAALDEILGLYWRPLVVYAARLLGGHDAAEDVTQEVFIRFWEKKNCWTPSDCLRSFLYRIARNLALNEQRGLKVRARWARQSERQEQCRGPTPIQIVENSELHLAVERAIEALPARRREVFVLARFQNLSYRQIAEVMGISPQTVANQMSAAIADLRGSLEWFMDEPTPSSLPRFRSPAESRKRTATELRANGSAVHGEAVKCHPAPSPPVLKARP